MSTTITRIHLVNYKRFLDYTVEPNSNVNILAGDNEVGKSSILEAIDLVASGNVRRVEAIGIDRLLNMDAICTFMAGAHTFDRLPKLIIELYLDGHGAFGPEMNGKNNTLGILGDGIRLICQPNPDFYNETIKSMQEQADYFPYDYYSVRFSTFADDGYSGYKKKLRTILIDSSAMNTEYATNDFVKRMYHKYTENHIEERAVHRSQYRQLKDSFRSDSLDALNRRIPDSKYVFGLKMTATTEFENDLTTEHKPEEDQVHIIDVHGLSFKRYLEIAVLLGIKVAVVTDNDHDKQKHCIEKYQDYAEVTTIQIFTDSDNNNYTFEVVLYGDNPLLCDTLFGANALNYMLKNKTEAAYKLLEQEGVIVVPKYIQEAIEWIRE